MRVLRHAVILTALAAMGLAAQETYPLRELRVEGNDVISDERIVAASGLTVGESVAEPDFQAALRRLDDIGLFETIAYKFGPKDDGYLLTFEVVEVENLYTVAFQGFDSPDEELTALLEERVPLYIGKAPGDGIMVTRIGNALQERWNAAGNDSKVVGQLIPGDGERLVMLFRPEERIEYIAYVNFEGSDAIPALELQRRFNPIAMGEQYSEARLRELLIFNVRPWFEEKGLMDVEFCPCSSEPDPDSRGVLVKVQVQDGPVYSWGKVEPPAAPGVGESRMEEIFAFRGDESVNMQKARDAQSALDEEMRKRGFLRVESDIEVQINNQSKTVTLLYALTPGAQYTFRRLEIVGLDILAEPVVRKRWGLEQGQPYNPSYPAFFLSRVEADQMFDNLSETSYQAQIDETSKTVTVTLDFEGQEKKKKYLPDVQLDKPF